MKRFKKGIALFLAALMVIVSVPTITGAESLFDAATEISPMEFVSVKFTEAEYESRTVYYAITLPKAGTITLNCGVIGERYYDSLKWRIMDEHGTSIEQNRSLYNNYNYVITGLQAGTYYLSIYANSYNDSFTNFYYTFTPDKTPTVAFSITLKTGTELQLGALITNSKDKAKWTSSKKSVATVSSKGLVKAVKAGTTYIKATLPTGEYASIKVNVKDK